MCRNVDRQGQPTGDGDVRDADESREYIIVDMPPGSLRRRPRSPLALRSQSSADAGRTVCDKVRHNSAEEYGESMSTVTGLHSTKNAGQRDHNKLKGRAQNEARAKVCGVH